MNITSVIKRRAREFVTGKAFPTALNLVFISLVVSVGASALINSSGQMEWIRMVAAREIIPNGSQLSMSLVGLFSIQMVLDIIIGVFLIGTSWSFVQWRATKKAPAKPFSESVRFWRRDTLIDSVVLVTARVVFTSLWSLLFVIPGIIKQYSYSQAIYLYAEDVAAGRPIQSARAYLKRSARMMRGHKMELFVIQLSFIGWFLLEMLTFNLSAMYSRPYYVAAMSEFYLMLRVKEAKENDAN